MVTEANTNSIQQELERLYAEKVAAREASAEEAAPEEVDAEEDGDSDNSIQQEMERLYAEKQQEKQRNPEKPQEERSAIDNFLQGIRQEQSTLGKLVTSLGIELGDHDVFYPRQQQRVDADLAYKREREYEVPTTTAMKIGEGVGSALDPTLALGVPGMARAVVGGQVLKVMGLGAVEGAAYGALEEAADRSMTERGWNTASELTVNTLIGAGAGAAIAPLFLGGYKAYDAVATAVNRSIESRSAITPDQVRDIIRKVAADNNEPPELFGLNDADRIASEINAAIPQFGKLPAANRRAEAEIEAMLSRDAIEHGIEKEANLAEEAIRLRRADKEVARTNTHLAVDDLTKDLYAAADSVVVSADNMPQKGDILLVGDGKINAEATYIGPGKTPGTIEVLNPSGKVVTLPLEFPDPSLGRDVPVVFHKNKADLFDKMAELRSSIKSLRSRAARLDDQLREDLAEVIKASEERIRKERMEAILGNPEQAEAVMEVTGATTPQELIKRVDSGEIPAAADPSTAPPVSGALDSDTGLEILADAHRTLPLLTFSTRTFLNASESPIAKPFFRLWEKTRMTYQKKASAVLNAIEKLEKKHGLAGGLRNILTADKASYKAWDEAAAIANRTLDPALATPAARELAQLIDRTHERLLREAMEVGVISKSDYAAIKKAYDKNGFFVRRFDTEYLRSAEGANAFVKMLRENLEGEDVARVLTNLLGEGVEVNPIKQAIITGMKNGTKLSDETINRMSKAIFRKQQSLSRKTSAEVFRALPRYLEEKLEPFMQKDKRAVFATYVEEMEKRIEYARSFGADDLKAKKTLGELAKTDPRAAASAYESYLYDSASPESKYAQSVEGMQEWLKTTTRRVLGFQALKLAHTAILQLIQVPLNGTILMAKLGNGGLLRSITNLMKGVRDTWTSAGRDFGELSGAAFEQVFISETLGTLSSQTRKRNTVGGWTDWLLDTSRNLRIFQFTRAENFNRRLAANVGKYVLYDSLKEVQKLTSLQTKRGLSKFEKFQLDKNKTYLEELGISPARVDELLEVASKSQKDILKMDEFGDLTANEVMLASRAFSDLVNFSTGGAHTSPLLKNPYAKIFVQFKTFSAHQTDFVWRNVYKPVLDMPKVYKEHGAQAAMSQLAPLVALLGVGTPVGMTSAELTDYVKNLRGQDRELAEQYVKGLHTVMAAGLFTQTLGDVAAGKGGTGLVRTVAGPTLGGTAPNVLSFAGGVVRATRDEEKAFVDNVRELLNNLLKRELPAYAPYTRK